MTTLTSPYDKLDNVDDCSRVAGYISKDDYNLLFRQVFPLRGAQTKLIAALLKKLVDHVNTNRTSYHDFDLDNEQRVATAIDGLSFGRIDDEADQSDGRLGIAPIHQTH